MSLERNSQVWKDRQSCCRPYQQIQLPFFSDFGPSSVQKEARSGILKIPAPYAPYGEKQAHVLSWQAQPLSFYVLFKFLRSKQEIRKAPYWGLVLTSKRNITANRLLISSCIFFRKQLFHGLQASLISSRK